jgi:hypothetical protein
LSELEKQSGRGTGDSESLALRIWSQQSMVYGNVRVSDLFRLLRPLAILIASIVLAAMGLGISFADEPISTYVRKSPAGADSVIVFVHGLREDGKTTWTNTYTNAYWPALLTHDHTFDNSDIFVYSYPTGLWATLSIDELADNMRLMLDGVTTPPMLCDRKIILEYFCTSFTRLLTQVQRCCCEDSLWVFSLNAYNWKSGGLDRSI